MERLTEKRDGQNVIPLRQNGEVKWALSSAGMGDAPTQFLYGVHADKLAEYEDLQEQGKLLKLPCAVGDVVYQTNKFLHRVCEHVINRIEMDQDGIWINDTSDNVYSPDDFGKIVFLAQEEADAALKKMEESK